MVAVPAQLGARLLHSCNGGSRYHAGDGAAGGHVPVARDLLQLVDLLVDDRYVDVAQGLSGNGLDAVVAQRPVHMDKVPAQVCILLFVHRPVRPDEVPGPGIGQHILQDSLVAPVYVFLGGLAHIDVAKAAGASRRAEQGIEHKGVEPMVIPAPVPVACLVFRGKEHRVAHEFAVVQHRFGALPLLVVPVNYRRLLRGIHPVFEYIAVSCLLGSQLALQLGVLLQKQIVVPQPQIEDVSRLLDVRNAAFPIEIQHVNAVDADVAQAVQLVRVPEDSVDTRTGFQLVVHDPVVGVLKVLLLQNDRQDAAQDLGQLLVSLLPGQHIGPGEIVHGFGVFVGDGIEQPPRGGLHRASRPPAHTFPVAHPVPLLVLNDPPLQVGLALPAAVQDHPGGPDLFRPNLHCLLH